MRDALIEAAARALYAHVEGVDAEANKPHMDYWFGNPDPADKMLADEYRADATAVLNAILSLLDNPTDEMVEAGHLARQGCTDVYLDGSEVINENSTESIWSAMLNTIKEKDA